jgi:hypothetical protein
METSAFEVRYAPSSYPTRDQSGTGPARPAHRFSDLHEDAIHAQQQEASEKRLVGSR